jgi:hypothetical protein
MHAKHDTINVSCHSIGIPAHAVWQQTCISQSAFCRLKYGIIAARDLVATALQGQCQAMHGAATYGDEMHPHQ